MGRVILSERRLAALIAAGWDETEHPRDRVGRFARKNTPDLSVPRVVKDVVDLPGGDPPLKDFPGTNIPTFTPAELGLSAHDRRMLKRLINSNNFDNHLILNSYEDEEKTRRFRERVYDKIGQKLGYSSVEISRAIAAEAEMVGGWMWAGPESGYPPTVPPALRMMEASKRLRAGLPAQTNDERGLTIMKAYTQMFLKERGAWDTPETLVRIVAASQANFLMSVIDEDPNADIEISINPLSSWAHWDGVESIMDFTYGHDTAMLTHTPDPNSIWATFWGDERMRTDNVVCKGEYIIDPGAGLRTGDNVTIRPLQWGLRGAHSIRRLRQDIPDLTQDELLTAIMWGQFSRNDFRSMPAKRIAEILTPLPLRDRIRVIKASGVDSTKLRRIMQMDPMHLYARAAFQRLTPDKIADRIESGAMEVLQFVPINRSASLERFRGIFIPKGYEAVEVTAPGQKDRIAVTTPDGVIDSWWVREMAGWIPGEAPKGQPDTLTDLTERLPWTIGRRLRGGL